MKKIIYLLVLTILVLYILLFPEAAVKAAGGGLVLWYTKMLPTLLPFAILSHIFVTTGILHSITRVLHRILYPVFPVNQACVYPLLAGFLFGFPLGSRITAQLVSEGRMDDRDGIMLFSICNNISPVFISGYILTAALLRPDLSGITLLILYLPPLAYYAIAIRIAARRDTITFRTASPTKEADASPSVSKTSPSGSKASQPGSSISFSVIDAAILNGFETLTKIGGYIMLFAIFSQMISLIPFPTALPACLLTGLIEITNGISTISQSPLSFRTKYILIILCTAFGGLSGLAQTASMTKEARFPMWPYLKTKLICTLASTMLAFLLT